MEDNLAAADARALAEGAIAPGWQTGEATQSRGPAKVGNHPIGDASLAAMYRARAELRLALWQAPLSVWERGAMQSAGGEQVGLPDICRRLADLDRERTLRLSDADPARELSTG